MQRSKKGFTILEILLVTAILLIVTSFALPAVFREIRRAEDMAALTTLRSVQSVHRITRNLMLLEERDNGLKAGGSLRIPQQAGDSYSSYADEIADSIDNAFAGTPPLYEIVEKQAQDGLQLTFYYWPRPTEKPLRCYVLTQSGLYRAERVQPAAEQQAQKNSADSTLS